MKAIRALPRNVITHQAKISTLHCFFFSLFHKPRYNVLALGLQYGIWWGKRGKRMHHCRIRRKLPSCCDSLLPGPTRTGITTQAGSMGSVQGGLQRQQKHFTALTLVTRFTSRYALSFKVWQGPYALFSWLWCLFAFRSLNFMSNTHLLLLFWKPFTMGPHCQEDTGARLAC